jgi:hypothetical protein
MEDWGEIKLVLIDHKDFWYLFDELCNDKSGFYYNRSTILKAYKNGNLYGLRVTETDQMYERGARMYKVFCENSWYLLPCFCIKENNTALIMWTHSRARRMGFAKKLVELLHIEYAYKPVPDSVGFWTKCGVKCVF